MGWGWMGMDGEVWDRRGRDGIVRDGMRWDGDGWGGMGRDGM